MNLQSARVVVTGGAGFIGSHLVRALGAAGADVVVADLPDADIRYAHIVDPLIHGADYVFHQAALHWKKCQENPRLCFEVMVDGTFNVLEASQKAKVKHVVMASSAKVYGLPTFYGAAKLAGENMAKAFDVPVTVLRYFNVYGPGQKEGVMAEWQKRLDAGLPLQVFGDPRIDLVHVDEVVRANLVALEDGPGTYDVRSGTETRLLDLAATLGPVEQMIDSDNQARPLVGGGSRAG